VAGNGDELDRLAQNLNEMLERIWELMRGLREVSDNIAHDLKTPLTRLRNRADEAVRSAVSAEELRLAMEGVIEESDGLIRVFNALLMIARLEGVAARDLMAQFDVGATAREVGELYEAVAADEGLSLEIATTGDLRFVGSRELIGQALANLVDNAVKYGAVKYGAVNRQAGGIRVAAERAGDTIRLTVADRGPGIPEEARGRVLDRFVRLEDSRSRPGFGLGLSLVAAIVRLHQGTLTLADNAPGLAVVVTLPAVAVGDPA
jgi:signal transduction histidine kinase